MLYYVTLGHGPLGSRIVVELTDLADGGVEARVNGRSVPVDVLIEGRRLCARVDGRTLDVVADGTPPRFDLVGRGIRTVVHVESERDSLAVAERGPRLGGPTGVKSPMPGRVIRVLVNVGDHVRPGQGLLVIEAMKMENELRAIDEAIVAEIHVSAGTNVDASTKLVTLSAPFETKPG